MTAIAIFVKTPGLSPIKTRLSQSIGEALAETWHQQAALAVAEVAQQANIGPVYWAVAEPKGKDSPLWSGHERLVQPKGALGQRMSKVHAQLIERHGGGILLGADTPQLKAEELRMAHAWLEVSHPRQVIGPARDGGFWLYGANHLIGNEHWASVEYSQAQTRASFVKAMHDQGELLTLSEKTDLDYGDDMAWVQQELMDLTHPTPKQRSLLAWLSTHTSQ